MKRCKKCVQTNTRPGIKFNDDGICYPCITFEKRKQVNWNKRWNELEQICNLYRKEEGHDCLITVSGGKDSTFQVGLIKEKLNMNPICFMIDNGPSWTKTGRENFYNLSERFDVDIITYTPSVKKMKELTKKGFKENLWAEEYWDSILYDKPMEMATKLGIDLVFWGEDTSYFTGGEDWMESSNALKQSSQEIRRRYCTLNVLFLSYFIPWSRYDNLEYARKNGFKTLKDTGEWDRDGLQGLEFEQVDTVGYLTNQYCKFIKFGFSSQTEILSDMIRHGRITRELALQLVNKYDWRLDEKMLDDFCDGIGISRMEFFHIVCNFVNHDILEIREGNWRLKEDAT